MAIPMIHHPGYTIELPERHPFPMRKFRVLREQLATPAIDRVADWMQPEPAERAMLARAHKPEYIDAFLTGRTDPTAQRRTGFRWSEDLVERVRLETAGTVLAVEAALAQRLALNTAGGTHHAHADAGSGYCLINDIAVAARHALACGWAKRILVVDLDVHQGDGTAGLFEDEPAVFTFSMHAGTNFPARKRQGDLDIALDKGVSDAEYLRILENTLPRLLSEFNPDLVIYDAGVDVHTLDRLGHLDLSDEGITRRDTYVLQTCREGSIPVAGVIGGGYDRDIGALAQRHSRLFTAAATL